MYLFSSKIYYDKSAGVVSGKWTGSLPEGPRFESRVRRLIYMSYNLW